MYTCFFIGHRDTPSKVLPALEKTIQRHVLQYGVTDFVVGCYGRFDSMAAQVVRRMKSRDPAVKLTLLLPYYPTQRTISYSQNFDDTFYPPGQESVPRRVAILRADRYMLDHCAYLIAYARYPGNAKNLLGYARRKGTIHIENLA